MDRFCKTLGCAVAAGLLSGCFFGNLDFRKEATQPPAPVLDALPPPIAAAARPASAPASAPAVVPAPEPIEVRPPPVEAAAAPPPPSVIYFDTDAYKVRPEYQPLLERHARTLKADPRRRLLVRAHADARGAADYNLALAEKRAEMVIKALRALGVAATQLEPLAYGEQQSAPPSADLSGSRRVELIYRP